MLNNCVDGTLALTESAHAALMVGAALLTDLTDHGVRWLTITITPYRMCTVLYGNCDPRNLEA
jgi:hypothetical protein